MNSYINNTKELVTNKLFNKYLYHYTKLDTVLKYILPSSTLRMTPLKDVNDPIENKFDADLIFISNKLSINFETANEKFLSTLKDLISNKTKVLCFSQDNEDKLVELNNHVNIELGRGYAKPRMWAQYADNHRGVCLVFEKNKLIEQFSKSFTEQKLLEKINYCDTYGIEECPYSFNISNEDNDIKSNLKNHILKYSHEYLFRKLSDWRDEDEFRMLIIDNDNEYKFFSYNDSLNAIILGDKFPDEYICCLKKFGNVYIGKLEWNRNQVRIRHIT